MTLPDDDVINFLENHFILGHKNIHKDEHVGMSRGYSKTQHAVGTTNGAGGRNVQFLVIAPDGVVLHALPGFWHPKDLIRELKLALEIHRLHGDEGMTISGKLKMYELLHTAHMRRYGEDMAKRSQWQGFDRWEEISELKKDPARDTFRKDDNGEYELKTIPEIVHDRMLARPFRKLDDFDVETFVDYGRPYYDNNSGVDRRGKQFRAAEKANRKRAEEEREAAEQAARDAARLARASRKKRRR